MLRTLTLLPPYSNNGALVHILIMTSSFHRYFILSRMLMSTASWHSMLAKYTTNEDPYYVSSPVVVDRWQNSSIHVCGKVSSQKKHSKSTLHRDIVSRGYCKCSALSYFYKRMPMDRTVAAWFLAKGYVKACALQLFIACWGFEVRSKG